MLKLAAPIVAAVVLFVACDTKVKQQAPPRIPDADDEAMSSGEGADIQAAPDAGVELVEKKKVTPEERRMRCCKQCVEGLDNDKTGDPPEKIPCQDFTVYVKNVCLKWFHDNPMTAAEARVCVSEEKGTSAADLMSAPPADPSAKPATPKGK